jgi:uncharacterized protein YbcV (DUF1398 family)
MMQNWKDVARATLAGSEDGTLTFPASLQMLREAGVEGYAVDFRRSTRTYYTTGGEALELQTEVTAERVAERFDAAAIVAALREAQALVQGYTYKGFCAKVVGAGCAGTSSRCSASGRSTTAAPARPTPSTSRGRSRSVHSTAGRAVGGERLTWRRPAPGRPPTGPANREARRAYMAAYRASQKDATRLYAREATFLQTPEGLGARFSQSCPRAGGPSPDRAPDEWSPGSGTRPEDASPNPHLHTSVNSQLSNSASNFNHPQRALG